MYTKEREQSYLVLDCAGRPQYWFVRESTLVHDESGQDVLKQYVSDASIVFKNELDKLLGSTHVFTTQDEERLKTMLKLLIDARKTWQEEEIALTGSCCD